MNRLKMLPVAITLALALDGCTEDIPPPATDLAVAHDGGPADGSAGEAAVGEAGLGDGAPKSDARDDAKVAGDSGADASPRSDTQLADAQVTDAACPTKAYYKDGDNDGYGDAAQRVLRCNKPHGYVANKDDCDDVDKQAHPFQAGFFDTASAGKQTFDYNCDGNAEKEITKVHAGCPALALGCSGGDGWKGAAPACGKQGTYVKCTAAGLICAASESPRRQTCR